MTFPELDRESEVALGFELRSPSMLPYTPNIEMLMDNEWGKGSKNHSQSQPRVRKALADASSRSSLSVSTMCCVWGSGIAARFI